MYDVTLYKRIEKILRSLPSKNSKKPRVAPLQEGRWRRRVRRGVESRRLLPALRTRSHSSISLRRLHPKRIPSSKSSKSNDSQQFPIPINTWSRHARASSASSRAWTATARPPSLSKSRFLRQLLHFVVELARLEVCWNLASPRDTDTDFATRTTPTASARRLEPGASWPRPQALQAARALYWPARLSSTEKCSTG